MPCAVCGRKVVPVPGDQRRGPEGLLRCSEHVGSPLPKDMSVDLEPEPEEGEDFELAKDMEFDVIFSITVKVKEKVWVTGRAQGDPVEPDNTIRDKALEALSEIADVDEATITDHEYITTQHSGWYSRREGAEKLTEDGEPFDLEAWRDEQLREEYGDVMIPRGQRPERTLEGFA